MAAALSVNTFNGTQKPQVRVLSIRPHGFDMAGKLRLGAAYLFIAHDLSMVKYISDRIGVLHLGHLVETGTTDDIFDHPIHPYTKSLLSAIPQADPGTERERTAVSYDYAASGIDYTKGSYHRLSETHSVLATEKDFEMWRKN